MNNSLEEQWTIIQNQELKDYIQELAIKENDMISYSDNHLYFKASRRTELGYTATYLMLSSCGTVFESEDCGYFSTREQALQALSNSF